MIHCESGNPDPVPVKHDSFFDFVRKQLYALWRIVLAPDADIDSKRPGQVFHQLSGTLRAPNLQWLVPFTPGPTDPSGQPEIGKAYDVIGMVVRKKYSGNFAERYPQLVKPLHGAATGINDEFIVADFYESAGSKAIQSRWRRTGPQKSNPKKISK